MSAPAPNPSDNNPPERTPALDKRDPRLDAPTAPAAPPSASRAAGRPSKATGSKTSGVLIAIVTGAVVLILLLVFILQNLQRVSLQFLFLGGRVPVGVAILLAAIAGALIVAIAAGARILQLRRRADTWKR